MQTISVIGSDASESVGLWQPIVGRCADRLALPSPEVRDEACQVLARCVPPTQSAGRKTGIVIGYIQSGKTSSFTTVSALARDNGYQMVLLVSGSSINLYRQSSGRIVSALQAADSAGWVPLFSSDLKARNLVQCRESIASCLGIWQDSYFHPSQRKTIILCVMKNATHLRHVVEMLDGLALETVRALIIDDEADQASLNFGIDRGTVTAIHSHLTTLRGLFPHVTYLQYTATPQAPLLIRLTDVLSPQFCRVLTAGSRYTGPFHFFDADIQQLVREIPATHLESAQTGDCPRSLVDALRIYYLGVCAHMCDPEASGERNRSMMIHPSQRTSGHTDYEGFVRALTCRWTDALGPGADAEERDLVVDGFRMAFHDLAQTVPGLEFEALLERLPSALATTPVTVMNATSGAKQVNWHLPYHILIGGMMLDRGFTVEGLTVTYMPRDQSLGAVDSIQQRARWFGYKERYLGYCRVYLTGDSIDTYRTIVEHEEHMRETLRKHDGPMQEWRRRFFLDPRLRPTRRQVIGLELIRGGHQAEWFRQKAPQGVDQELTKRNWEVVSQLLDGLSFEPFSGNPRLTDSQRHMVAHNVSLREVYEKLLNSFVCEDPSDASSLVGLAMQVSWYLDKQPSSCCAVVKMACSPAGWMARERSQDNIHQGANNATGYRGDSHIRADTGFTLQIHRLRRPDSPPGTAWPAIAVYIPPDARKPWIVEQD